MLSIELKKPLERISDTNVNYEKVSEKSKKKRVKKKE